MKLPLRRASFPLHFPFMNERPHGGCTFPYGQSKPHDMKRILILGLAALFALSGAQAQRFDQLWGEADAAVRDDLPRTALTAVRRVWDKALAEGNDAELLRAALAAQQLQAALSPDSGRVALARMERAAARETRPVVRALWHSALGRLYASGAVWADTAARRRVCGHLSASLADLPALGEARAADFVPLFREGADSRYFDGDVLHVLWGAATGEGWLPDSLRSALSASVARYYDGAGRRAAALLVRLDSARSLRVQAGALDCQPSWLALDSLARAYRDVPANVETYIALTACSGRDADDERADSLRLAAARTGLELYGGERRADALRNFVALAGQPSLRLSGSVPACYPGQTFALALEGRNVRLARVRLTRLDLAASALDRPSGGWTLKELRRHAAGGPVCLDRAFAPAPSWRRQADTVRWTPARAGLYLCELMAEGRVLDHRVVHVSALLPLQLAQPDGTTRLVVLDARSGHPVPGVRLQAVDGKGRQRSALTLGDSAQCLLRRADDGSVSYYVSTPGDAAAPAFTLSGTAYSPTPADADAAARPEPRVELFTDRAVYRPGQTVRLGAVAYTRAGDRFEVAPRFEAWARLLDANRRVVDSVRLEADAFGAAGGSLQLPAAALTGRFSVRLEWQDRSFQTGFQVEEYKRPTFTAEAEPVREAYALGDTVRVWGRVRTYTDLPVAGATVRWRVTRRAWFATTQTAAPASGVVATDADGRFCVPVALSCAPGELGGPTVRRFSYVLEFDATAGNGETASGSYTLSAATQPAWLVASWPAYVCREQLPSVEVWQRNAQGENLEADGSYELWQEGRLVRSGTFRTGRAFVPRELADVPSGAYQLVTRLTPSAAAIAAPDTARLLLFSENDTRPVAPDVCWTYVRRSTGRDSARVLIGSPRDSVLMFYDLFAAGRLVESRRVAFSDSLLRFDLAWQPAYGDAARAVFAFVKDGQVCRYETAVERPAPDKRLLLSWSTFRSRLTPGQQEEWRLRVSYPDGRPARASVMARLYDASLDAFAFQPWQFGGLGFYRPWPVAWWQGGRAASLWLAGEIPVRTRRVPQLDFTAWADGLFSYGRRGYAGGVRNEAVTLACADEMQAGPVRMSRAVQSKAATQAVADLSNERGAGGEAAQAAGTGPAAAPRSNFAETAYFHPSLHTDSAGVASICFTLPESLTSWRFTALAHSEAMDHGSLDTTVVARKDFMVQPALPRFVREGDRTVLPATLRNLLSRPVEVTVRLLLTDAGTGETVDEQHRKVRVEADSTCYVDFPFEAAEGLSVLVCRLTAEGDGFSDGEEHYLPVLADRVEVTRSVPFSLTEAGTEKLRLDTLWSSPAARDRRLTVELSSNPAWYAVAALPVLADAPCLNAEQWATRYYALKFGGYVARLNPEVKAAVDSAAADEAPADALGRLMAEQAGWAEETPWLAAAAAEASRAAALRSLFDPAETAAREYTALDKLRGMQRADGSWSWYEGMAGNVGVTTQVALLLARVQAFTGDSAAAAVLQRAAAFLQREAAARTERLREAERRDGVSPQLPADLLRYLYVRALMGLEPDDDARYLTTLAERQVATMNLQDKAAAVLVLAQAGRSEAARTQLRSLMEYTVEAPGRGRYFDTSRAPLSRESYRIPTQTAVIEALLRFYPAGNERVESMRLWLMQAKRTQAWETDRATADAVYALLAASPLDSRRANLTVRQPLYYTLTKGRRIVGVNAASTTQAAATAGYTHDVYTDGPALQATDITVRKAGEGLSWGAVYASFSLPADEVKAEGSGLAIARRFEVMRGSEWQPLAEGEAVAAGERVRQVLTLRAAADYDFVRVRVARPACLQPVHPLSGYVWLAGTGCYRAVHDASTDFFLEHVAKGEHVLTEESVADRAGTYQCGLAEAECVYAPEFNGRTAGFRLQVK